MRMDAETPAVVIDSDRVDRNIAKMAAITRDAGVDLRPHAKTHKMPALARRQIEAGAVGITVAKVGEAEVFVDAGIDDILVAYPLWGEGKWNRLCDLAERARITAAADSAVAISGLAAVAAKRGLTIPVRIELDTGFGRCGVQDVRGVIELANLIADTPGVELDGLMSFAGQSYARGLEGVEMVAREDAALITEAADILRGEGFEIRAVSVGGTPTAAAASRLPGVTEVRPGTYIFSDRDQAALGWGSLSDCALTVLVTVVSRPTATRAIIDGGTKTFSSDQASQGPGWGVVLGHPGVRIDRMSEEHGILELPAASDIQIGTVLRVIPNHACGTLNMHDEVLVAEGDQIIDRWEVAARAKLR